MGDLSVAKVFFGKDKKRLVVVIVAAFVFIGSGIFSLLQRTQPVHAATDTCTWTGAGADANLSTAGNWTGCDNGNIPEVGDTVVFPTGPTNKAVTIDSDTDYANVTFSGSGYTVSSSGFSTLGISDNLTISGNNNNFSGYIRFYPTATATLTHSGTGTSFGHYLAVQPFADDTNLIFDIQTDLSLPMIAQTAPGVGSSIDTVTKNGIGDLEITGTAIAGLTTGGGIKINEGNWKCDSSNCLGDTANEIILDEGGDPDGSGIIFNYDGTVANPITVNAATEQNSSVSAWGDVTFNGAITVHDDLHFFVVGTHTATVGSNVTIDNNKTLTIYGDSGYAANAAVFNGNISGTGAGIIVDDAHVTLAGTNTYTGTTELFSTGGGAVVTVKDNNSLGNSSAGTIVNNGTTLNFDNTSDVSYDEPITVAGTGVGGSYPGALVKTDQYVALLGGITLTGNTTWHNETGETFVIASVITGNYNITMTGNDDTGGFGLQPGGNNTFANLIANGIQLTLAGAGNTAVPHNLTMNAVSGKLSRVWLNNDNMIANNSVVTLNNDGSQVAYLLNTGVSDTVGTIVGDGTIVISDADGRFALSDASGEFTGILNGYTGSEIEIDGGTWTFSGRGVDAGNGYEGFYVNGGKFVANAADTSLSLSHFSMSAGTLGGTGLIGAVSVYSGTISPGNSPGCLYPAGDVAFTDPNSYYYEQIQGDTACTGYDVLNASGTVYLNDATLIVELPVNVQLTHGHVYTIVQGSAVSGTFDGLADGATVNVGQYPFRINYNANNVTLTYTGETTTTSTSSSNGTASEVSDGLAPTGSSVQLALIEAAALILSGSIIGLRSRTKYFRK